MAPKPQRSARPGEAVARLEIGRDCVADTTRQSPTRPQAHNVRHATAKPWRASGSVAVVLPISRMQVTGACAVVLALVFAAACARAGGPKVGAPSHHREGGFANTNPAIVRPGFWIRTTFFVSRVWSSTFSPRHADLPRVPNDGRSLRDNRDAATVTWVGHSTLLLQLDGVNVLTDPQWSDRASPFSFAGPRRVSPPGLAFDDLPPIHVVLISHDHYDHLDVATVRLLAARHRPRFLAPLGFRAWFATLGITDVEELDWWQSRSERGLEFTCVPAQHFSGRTLWDRNRRLWAGFTIAGRTKRVFFSGDTAYYDVFKEIGARLGPFDLAAIAIGAYLPAKIMKPSHTTPEEALRIFSDVRGERFVPIHWGTFDLAEEPIAEPPERLAAAARSLGLGPDRVWILKHGETRRW
ncbi:MAG: MBL fold metallo-hydrolase [Candidatus Rokuibacteriota bacterium]|nr:MAG: MBL fold metallo-hydrolase [Candidatus Rokubacteria bacterium]